MRRLVKITACSLVAGLCALNGQAVSSWRNVGNSWNQAARIDGPRGPSWGWNATAVAIWRDYAVVGFPGSSFGGDRIGSVKLLKRQANGTWQDDAYLNPYQQLDDVILLPLEAFRGWLGASVSIWNDNTVAAGAPRYGNGNGAAWVFERNGAAWTKTKLEPGNIPAGARAGISEQGPLFGHSIAVSGPRVFVGAPGLNRVYVFVRQALGNWRLETQLNGVAGSQFGHSVSLSGDRAMIGAPLEVGGGAVYVYERSNAQGWQSVRAFRNNGGTERLGFAVSIDGTSGVAGMPLADGWLGDNQVEDAGGAVFYCKPVTNWICEEEVDPSVPRYENVYGGAVSLSGNRAAIAAPGIAVEERDQNDLYLYERTGHDWREIQRLSTVENPELGFQFGESVSLRNARMAVGGQNQDAAGRIISSAYVYEMKTSAEALFESVANTVPQATATTPSSVLQNSALEYTVAAQWFGSVASNNSLVVELWDVRNIKVKTDTVSPGAGISPGATRVFQFTPTAGNMPVYFKVYQSRPLADRQPGARVTIRAKWLPYEQ